ncbi:hypothetical protein BT69DRAFT_1284958 [Atractiella rhizophila]|nr:hypothetical protein BT69DRAFT_1284958 [Atractiella rhizophila]
MEPPSDDSSLPTATIPTPATAHPQRPAMQTRSYSAFGPTSAHTSNSNHHMQFYPQTPVPPIPTAYQNQTAQIPPVPPLPQQLPQPQQTQQLQSQQRSLEASAQWQGDFTRLVTEEPGEHLPPPIYQNAVHDKPVQLRQ